MKKKIILKKILNPNSVLLSKLKNNKIDICDMKEIEKLSL